MDKQRAFNARPTSFGQTVTKTEFFHSRDQTCPGICDSLIRASRIGLTRRHGYGIHLYTDLVFGGVMYRAFGAAWGAYLYCHPFWGPQLLDCRM